MECDVAEWDCDIQLIEEISDLLEYELSGNARGMHLSLHTVSCLHLMKCPQLAQVRAKLHASLPFPQTNAPDAVHLQAGELRIHHLCAQGILDTVKESVQILAAASLLSIHTVSLRDEGNEEESIAILDALAPIAGSVVCCDLSGFR